MNAGGQRRLLWVHIIMLAALCTLAVRIFLIGQGKEYAKAAEMQSSYTLPIGEWRGMIYDCNLKPLVNRDHRTVLAVEPTPEAAAVLREELGRERFESILPLLESGRPTLIPADFPLSAAGITPLDTVRRYSEKQTAAHVIGYVDGEGKGVCGIEAGYDEALTRWGGSLAVRYTVNAWQMPVGNNAEVRDTRGNTNAGVVLTIDRELQAIAEESAKGLGCGAVVLMEVKTGAIRAMVSVPDYSPTDVAAVLQREDSPLFNRATAAWNVGSLFKICVAAAALENNISPPEDYFCGGYYELEDHRFYCHEHDGHGLLDLSGAFTVSCNPYFIALGQQVGGKALLAMAQRFGFGSKAVLAEGATSAAGSLPALAEMTAGELANFSFGQGKLTATPVQLAGMLSAVANGGYAVQPTLFAGISSDGRNLQPASEKGMPMRVLSADTADELRRLLVQVVEKGTGARARNIYCGSGGKTASAQTGSYADGQEIVHAWFGGFFPAGQPKYALVVFQEGGEAGGRTAATVFRTISEAAYLHEHPDLRREIGE